MLFFIFAVQVQKGTTVNRVQLIDEDYAVVNNRDKVRLEKLSHRVPFAFIQLVGYIRVYFLNKLLERSTLA